jgi:hypothetical protein
MLSFLKPFSVLLFLTFFCGVVNTLRQWKGKLRHLLLYHRLVTVSFALQLVRKRLRLVIISDFNVKGMNIIFLMVLHAYRTCIS